jgi:AcrR family transcriptional regulator
MSVAASELTRADESTAAGIVRAALRLFRAKGFEGTSLREISEVLGVTKAAIYYHFPSKEAVLVAVVEPLLRKTDRILRTARAESWNPSDVLTAILDVMIEHRDVVVALGTDIGAQARLQSLGAGADQEDRLVALLGGDTEDLARRAAAVGAVGVLRNGLIAFGERLPEAKPHILACALGALGSCD